MNNQSLGRNSLVQVWTYPRLSLQQFGCLITQQLPFDLLVYFFLLFGVISYLAST